MPYLIRTIGTEKFGLVSLIQAIQYYFIIFVDYGFSTIAVREISISRHDNKSLSLIFSRTLFAKLLLSAISLIVLLIILAAVPRFGIEWKAYLFGFSLVIGQALFPVWFFQGVEKMKFITYLNLFSKIIFVVCLFLLIRTKEDYLLFLPIQGIGVIVASLIGIFIIVKRFNVQIFVPKRTMIVHDLRNGASVFVSNFSVTSYNSSNYLILAFLVNDQVLGMFSIAEKIMSLLRQVLSMFSQAVFPKICWLASQSHSEVKRFWKEMTLPFGILVLVACCTTSFFSSFIVNLLTHENLVETAKLLSIIAWVPLIVYCNIPFFQTLMAYNYKNEVMNVLVTSSVCSILLSFILTYYFNALGTIATLLVTELGISIGLMLTLEKKKSISILF